jgi:hypothetical protein
MKSLRREITGSPVLRPGARRDNVEDYVASSCAAG